MAITCLEHRGIIGDKPIALFLNDYRRNRDREDWRMSTQAEEVCEYVLWLESKLEEYENES
jgi:hypothetical protein